MFLRRHLEGSSVGAPPLPLLLLLLFSPSLAADSLFVPWAARGGSPGAALQTLGPAPPHFAPEEQKQRLQAFLESDQQLIGDNQAWESPDSPDLFLLTEVAPRADGRRTSESLPWQQRRKRTGALLGSRGRSGGGGGFAGSAGGRMGPLGPSRMGGGSEGPSLSIVNPLDVLRQRLLLEIARRRMRESEDQIQANRELLKSIGKKRDEQIPTSM